MSSVSAMVSVFVMIPVVKDVKEAFYLGNHTK